MRIGIGVGYGPDPAKAARDAARQAKRGCPKPDLSLCFGSIYLDQGAVHSALCAELDPATLIGGSSYAEISPAGVTRDTVVVLLISAEGSSVRFADSPLRRDPLFPRATGEALARAMGRGPTEGTRALGLLIGSLSDVGVEESLHALGERLGRFPLFGGLTCGDYDAGITNPDFWANYNTDQLARRLVLPAQVAPAVVIAWPGTSRRCGDVA